MDANALLDCYQADPAGLDSTVLRHPTLRLQLYRALLQRPAAPFRPLLLLLLREEMAFRQEDAADEAADDDANNGIYHCAFLLYCCGDPLDTLALWEAKHIDMDVGCMLGSEFFLGAGAERTLAALAQHGSTEALALRDYIADCWAVERDDPEAAQRQRDWEENCAADIRGR